MYLLHKTYIQNKEHVERKIPNNVNIQITKSHQHLIYKHEFNAYYEHVRNVVRQRALEANTFVNALNVLYMFLDFTFVFRMHPNV